MFDDNDYDEDTKKSGISTPVLVTICGVSVALALAALCWVFLVPHNESYVTANPQSLDPGVTQTPYAPAPGPVETSPTVTDDENDDLYRTTTITPPEDAIEKLDNADIGVKNDWFYAQLKKANISGSKENMVSLRSQVCSKLRANDGDITESKELLEDKGLSDDQIGVVIAASNLSNCPDINLKLPLDGNQSENSGD